MPYFSHGAIIAAQQAQERKRQEQQEEEEMTSYSRDELENDWEFKIVRSETGAFRKSENFQKVLQEEAISGWELVEKLDDRRVRFKRPHNARRYDASLPPEIDPYRTEFGSSAARPALMVMLGLTITVLLGAGLLFTTGGANTLISKDVSAPVLGMSIVLLILVLGFVGIVVFRRSQR